MSASTILTVRLPVETKARLAKLAQHTNRKQSFLGAEAIAAYVTRELAIVEAIEQGRTDVRAGRTTPDADVTREASAIISAARSVR